MHVYRSGWVSVSLALILVAAASSVRAATVSVSGTEVLITLGAGENVSDLNTSIATNVITVNTVGSANNSLVGTPTGVTVTNNTVVIDTTAFPSFTGFQVLGSNTTNAVTVGASGILLSATTANTDSSVVINLSFNSGTGTLNVNGPITAKDAGGVTLKSATLTIVAAGKVTAAAGAVNITGTAITSAGNVTSGGALNLTGAITLSGPVSLRAQLATVGDITLSGSINGAQNLTLEAADTINVGDIGNTTALGTVTITNSAGVSFSSYFIAANVVATDTTGAISFNGDTDIRTSLTTAAKGYSLAFGDSSLDATTIAGAPVFRNTGNVAFQGSTALISGAAIVGGAGTSVVLANTIVSGGAFNIGAGLSGITISDGTSLILNSATAGSTWASGLSLPGSGTLNLLGLGALTLSADSSAGVAAGDIINVVNGTLNVTGKLGSSSTTALKNGTLTGPGGTMGALSSSSGLVAPNGTLNTAAVSLSAATNYRAEVLTATTASNLKTASSINLGGATLSLGSVASGLAVNNSFTIVNNTAASTVPIVGTFAGVPEGAIRSATDTLGNTVTFIISYKGGDSNDVTIKVASVNGALTPAFGSATATGNGFTVQISNFDANYTWAGTAWIGAASAFGRVAIDGAGLVTVTGVAMGTSATATITATRSGFAGGTALVTATSLAAPGAPTDVSAVLSSGRAVVSFTPPPSNGGAVITSYTVTATPTGGGAVVTATGSTSPVTITGLTSGITYTFVVTATNSVGVSIASGASTPAFPLAITTQPIGVTVAQGAPATFTVATSGSVPLSYQWWKNGVAISGATAATYSIAKVASTDVGSYTVTITIAEGQATSNAASLALLSSRLNAFSVRSYSGAANDTLIMGVVVAGSGTKNLVARGIGPNLGFYEVSGFLADPLLKLYSGSGALMQTIDDWGGGTTLTNAFISVGLPALPPRSKDAALVLNQSPGVFMMHLTSAAGTGIGLMELYDFGPESDTSRLAAVSVRGQVGTGANMLIVGFVITGSTSKQVIIRGVGPNLAASGVTGYMNDPQLKLFDSSGVQIGSNDDWGGGSTLANAFAAVGLASLPAASKDAALLATLNPGVYTVQLSGVNSTSGVGLIEFYEAP